MDEPLNRVRSVPKRSGFLLDVEQFVTPEMANGVAAHRTRRQFALLQEVAALRVIAQAGFGDSRPPTTSVSVSPRATSVPGI
jgi:hypothetical protein